MFFTKIEQTRRAELIETLWNVNVKLFAQFVLDIHELIETLWNVNKNLDRLQEAYLRINRNIVECKYYLEQHRKSRYTN